MDGTRRGPTVTNVEHAVTQCVPVRGQPHVAAAAGGTGTLSAVLKVGPHRLPKFESLERVYPARTAYKNHRRLTMSFSARLIRWWPCLALAAAPAFAATTDVEQLTKDPKN